MYGSVSDGSQIEERYIIATNVVTISGLERQWHNEMIRYRNIEKAIKKY
jgi:hypothetical protein